MLYFDEEKAQYRRGCRASTVTHIVEVLVNAYEMKLSVADASWLKTALLNKNHDWAELFLASGATLTPVQAASVFSHYLKAAEPPQLSSLLALFKKYGIRADFGRLSAALSEWCILSSAPHELAARFGSCLDAAYDQFRDALTLPSEQRDLFRRVMINRTVAILDEKTCFNHIITATDTAILDFLKLLSSLLSASKRRDLYSFVHRVVHARSEFIVAFDTCSELRDICQTSQLASNLFRHYTASSNGDTFLQLLRNLQLCSNVDLVDWVTSNYVFSTLLNRSTYSNSEFENIRELYSLTAVHDTTLVTKEMVSEACSSAIDLWHWQPDLATLRFYVVEFPKLGAPSPSISQIITQISQRSLKHEQLTQSGRDFLDELIAAHQRVQGLDDSDELVSAALAADVSLTRNSVPSSKRV